MILPTEVTTTIGQSGYFTAGSNVQLTCTVVTGDTLTLNDPCKCSWTKGGSSISNSGGASFRYVNKYNLGDS